MGKIQQGDRSNKRIRFRCRNTKCKFLFQVNLNETQDIWYTPHGTGNFNHTTTQCVQKLEQQQQKQQQQQQQNSIHGNTSSSSSSQRRSDQFMLDFSLLQQQQ